jgi:hypothetical protein
MKMNSKYIIIYLHNVIFPFFHTKQEPQNLPLSYKQSSVGIGSSVSTGSLFHKNALVVACRADVMVMDKISFTLKIPFIDFSPIFLS